MTQEEEYQEQQAYDIYLQEQAEQEHNESLNAEYVLSLDSKYQEQDYKSASIFDTNGSQLC